MAKRNKPIPIPTGVTLDKSDDKISVKGPLGQLSLKIHPTVAISIEKNVINVSEKKPESSMFVGTAQSHLKNMIKGVTEGFTKIIEVRGMGYRAQKTKDGIQLEVGFIHPVNFKIPKEISVDIKQVPNPDDTKEQMFEVTLKGPDKQWVGELAAEIRQTKKPDVYHGKGIRYKGEYVRKKAGKRAVATQA
jgi:large subunit ribosomal protein L6